MKQSNGTSPVVSQPKGTIIIGVMFDPTQGTAQSKMSWCDIVGGNETVLDILLLELTKIRQKMKQDAMTQQAEDARRIHPASALPPRPFQP